MKNLKSQNGSALLMVVGSVAILSIMTLTVGQNILMNKKMFVQTELDLGTLNQLDKTLSLASYFVTNNLVLCRDRDEGKWSSPINTQCIWGGEKYIFDKDGKTIGLDFYNLVDISSDNKYILKVPEKHVILSGEKDRSIELSFEVKDFSKSKEVTMKKLIGTKDIKFSDLDQDNKIIMISATAFYKDRAIGSKNALIRRPFSTPLLTIENPSACNLVCASGKSNNPNSECRSKNEVKRSYTVETEGGSTMEKDSSVEGENHLTLTVRNDGPGAIYRLVYFKKTLFDKENYLDMDDSIESVNVMPSDLSVLMPGKVITYEDKIPCLPPSKKTIVQTVESSNKSGTEVENSVHKENYMDLSYGFNLRDEHSDIVPKRLSENVDASKIDVTRDVGVTTITNYVSPPH